MKHINLVCLGICIAFLFNVSCKSTSIEGVLGREELPPTVYLRSTGNDTTGELNNINLPYLTAQAAVNAAIAAGPTADDPIIIDVGVGTFGNIVLTQNFGENVTWKGVDSTQSVIGNITANGIDYTAHLDGYDIELTVTSGHSVRFGDISANGSQGGIANGGDITIGIGAVVSNVTARGYGIFTGMTAGTANGGVGGTITIFGSAQTVNSNGGDGDATGGNAGTIIINGSVGDVYANGGLGNLLDCGHGGNVTINTGGSAQAIYANGGEFTPLGAGGNGGTVVLHGPASSVEANGGDGDGSGGNGGNVTYDAPFTPVDVWVNPGGGMGPPGANGYINGVQQ